MKNIILSLFLLFIAGEIIAQPTWTSAQTGLWQSASTWTPSGGASGAPPFQLLSNQRIIITNGHNVTVGSGGNSLLFQSTSSLTISNGGKLIMGNAGFPAPTFTMKDAGNTFTMLNGIYESYGPGAGGNMDIEAGTVNWQSSSLYVSGNYNFFSNSFITLINICLRSAQNQNFIGVGSSTNFSTLTDVFHICGVSGTGSYILQDQSFINVNNVRIIVGSQSGNAKFANSTVNGSIYSIFGNEAINVDNMSGTTTLNYRCAVQYNYAPAWFTGPQIIDCPLTQAQQCSVGILYSISGTVFNDPDGGTINGTGIGAAGGTQMYVSLVNNTGNIVSTLPVNSNGTYTFSNLGPGNYTEVLHTNPAGSTSSSLPAGWQNTAEGIIAAGDGTPNGIISSFAIPPNITTANFGIRQIPADLTISKSDSPDPVIAGNNLTYTIVVTNLGPGLASGVNVNDVLPAGLSFISATPSTGTWTSPNWTVGTLANGASANIVIVALVNPDVMQGTVLSNTATVTSTTNDPVAANNADTETTNVIARADLSLDKSVNNVNPTVGSVVTFSLALLNNGPSNATGVSLEDVVPFGYNNITNISGGGILNGNTITWSGISLPTGTNVVYTYQATVLHQTNAPGEYTNTAEVTIAGQLDPDSSPDDGMGDDFDTQNINPDDFPVAVNDAVNATEDTPLMASVTGNDTPSGDGGNVWSVVSSTTNGMLAFNTDGTYTYTPNANFNGTDNFTYQVCDVDGDCSTATVTININAVDDLPVANDDTNMTNEDTPIVGAATAGNDVPSGDGGNVWTLVGVNGGAANGSVTMNASGVYTYTPNANFNGTDVFTYQICDTDGDCESATVAITINPIDDLPMAVNDAVNATEDTPLMASVTGNDTPSGDGGNVWSVVSSTTNGMLAFNTDGTYTYTPNANFNGTDNFTYQVCDVDGDCSTATVTININAVDDLPVANDDTNMTNEDTPIVGAATAGNDVPSGDGGNVWTLVGVNGGAANGSVTMNASGVYTYTPNANFNGTDVFTYQICDTDGDCESATVAITINPVDDLPMAVNDAVNATEDTPLMASVTGNDTPSGDGGNVWSVLNSTTNGMLAFNTDGTYTYTPNANFNGTDNFTYQVCDVDGDCSTATVTININAVDDLPVANDDTNMTNEDTPIVGAATAGNDVPSGDGGNVWTLVGVNGGAANGSVTMNASGEYTYTPNANFNGTDVFTYQICDTDGDCESATVAITINPVDDLPMAVNDAVNATEDTPLMASVTGNDTPSGDGGNVWSVVSSTTNGMLAFNTDGTYTYTPNANFNGTDNFTYQVCDVDGDCSTATVTININAVDDLPVANDDTNMTNEDTPIVGAATAGNDVPSGDGGNVWTLVGVNGGAANGSVTMNASGEYTYTPNANFNGTDVFTYQICDTDGDCESATVAITINPVDDLPMAVNDAVNATEDTPLMASVTGNDTPSGDGGNVWSVVSSTTNGMLAFNTDGTYTYTPNANFNGTDNFTYQVCDVDGDCSTATVTININAVDDLPVANDDTNMTNEDTPIVGAATAGNDVPSGDGGNVWTLVGVNGGAANGSVTMNASGVYTYTPNANFNGTDVFTYQICDTDADCESATVAITINPVDDLPMAVNDAVNATEDTPLMASVTGNDTPSGDGGNVWSVVSSTTNGMLAFNTDGTYTYTPNANFNGTDNFTYQVCDVDGDCSTATVTININAVDDLPVANDDTNMTNEDTPIVGAATAGNDVPSGDGGNVWTLVGVNGGAANGSVTMNASGVYTYTPNANFNGTDVFTYQICDTDGDCESATVTITINAVNDPPIAVDNSSVNNESGSTVTIDIISNDSDPENNLDPGSVDLDPSSVPGGMGIDTDMDGDIDQVNVSGVGSWMVNAITGVISFIPDVMLNGDPPVIEYTISDLEGLTSNAASITITYCGVLQVQVFLEGPFIPATSSMTTNLNINHLLPGQNHLLGPSPLAPFFGASTPIGQPYDIGPWNHFGVEGDIYGDVSTNPGSIPYPPEVTDWVLVSVRQGDSSVISEIFKCAALLKSNGVVEFPNDCGCLDLTNPGPYYVLIMHRNHLPIMSDVLYPVNGTLSVDFRNQNSWIGELFPGFPFGTGQKEILPGVWAMLAGNGKTNPILEEYDINSADLTNWEFNQNIILRYNSADHTLDADVNSVDNTIWRINFNNVTLIPR